MGKKTTKRVLRKKYGKLLRKNLNKKSDKSMPSNPQQSMQANPQQSMTNANTLLSQLMNRMAMNPFGFILQLYDNINNEKRIDQIRQDNQTINNATHQNEATIEALKKENKQLKSEAKQKLKSVEQLIHEKEVLEAQRDEASRKGQKVDVLNIHIQSLTDQIEESVRVGNIYELQKQNVRKKLIYLLSRIKFSASDKRLRKTPLRKKLNALMKRPKSCKLNAKA